MRILLSSYAYAPGMGGIEVVSGLLAREWAAAGHEVRVVTCTPAGAGGADGAAEVCAVWRNPSWGELREQMRWCEVFYQNNISLRLAAAWPVARRPWVTTHATWLTHPGARRGVAGRVKGAVLGLGRSVAISRAIAESLPVPSVVIPNPYDREAFSTGCAGVEARAEGDVAFVGRLVSDKGADLLVEALGRLVREGLELTATIIGEGPEEGRLRETVRAAGLEGRVRFTGRLTQAEVAATLRRHRVLAVPSRWPEPFGLVALEGLAAGCRLVVSSGGGLAEAAGPLARVFASGSAERLAEGLRAELAAPALGRAETEAYLERFAPGRVAREYAELFEREAGR